jgi:hypothetical protein
VQHAFCALNSTFQPGAEMPNPNDWRSTDAGKSGGGGRSWQTSDAQPADGAAPVSRRAIKRTIAVIALLGLAIAIGVLIILPRAQRPACLIVVGSGYEQNLLLPHNVYGWNGASQLLKDNDIAESEAYGDKVRYLWSQPTLMRRVETPFELKETSWPETWDKIAKEIAKGSPQENVVLFMSMHGYADDSDAYLLRNVSDVQTPDGFKASRLAFGEVLKSLKDVKDKNIVLLLDVCHVQSHWPIGMLQNDFAERLKAYEKEIDALGNVTVICSAGPKERSWDNEEEQASAGPEGCRPARAGTNHRHEAVRVCQGQRQQMGQRQSRAPADAVHPRHQGGGRRARARRQAVPEARRQAEAVRQRRFCRASQRVGHVEAAQT